MRRSIFILPLMWAAAITAQPAFAEPTAAVEASDEPTLAPVDPALMAKARTIAAVVLPDGTMTRMFGPMMQKIVGPLTDNITKLPIQELLKLGGMDASEADKITPEKFERIMAIMDPAFRQRTRVMLDTMFPAMGKFMAQFEPDMREGMAEAFAARYNAAELDNISAFLGTPTGAKFGAGFMELAADPRYLAHVQKMAPQLMAAMPEILKPAIEQVEKLPKPRKFADLTAAERTEIATLLGIDPGKFKQTQARKGTEQ